MMSNSRCPMNRRPIFEKILTRVREPRRFIQALLGPRQVGKTTLALQIADELKRPVHYATADSALLEDLPWIRTQWEIGRAASKKQGAAVLILDEIQKIPRWSEQVKVLWDEDSRQKIDLTVILLGSSPWLVQQGLTESLAGRFETIPITHWTYQEMRNSFGFSVEQYVYFGGYPGAAGLTSSEELGRWRNYIMDSLIETSISRDVLLMTRVDKPALLRRLFQLGCNYSGQILSYTKMMGQLQDAGNSTTLSHYLELVSGAGLLTGLDKFASQSVRRRASSPKLQVFNNALMSAQSTLGLAEALADGDYWGRLVESAVGAHLINGIRGTDIELYYWREGAAEVDFVLRRGNQVTAIEVKSGRKVAKLSGLKAFEASFRPGRLLVVGTGGISVEDFLSSEPNDWV